MKACIIEKYGGIEELKIKELPLPKPGPDDVIVETYCASVNHLDLWIRKGARGSSLKMPHIMGSDASGIIKEAGTNIKDVKIGQGVIIYPGTSCGQCEYCKNGEATECLSFGIIGMSSPGTYAEYIKIPRQNIFPKPEHLSYEEASAFPLTFLTAWRMLNIKAKLKKGETILIHGIGGGVALAGLILAKAQGVIAIVTSSQDNKLSQASELGAGYTINYSNVKNIPAEVKKNTNSKGVDVVFDSVGAKTWPLDFDCVRKGGRIVFCGVTTGASAETNLRALYWNQISIYGSTMGSPKDFAEMLDFINEKKLKPVIDSVWPLGEIQKATSRMEEGKQFGKIILQMSS